MKIFLAESGGLWAAYFKGRGEQMKIHLVPNTQMLPENCDYNFAASIFSRANILQSFYYCDSFTEKVIIPNCGSFLLDSGAFTFMTGAKGKPVNWNEYLERYADFINRNKVSKFFELDIDSVVGYERVKQLRRQLERMTGRQCIPVWHKSRGKEDYIQMCDEYEYVAVGGIVAKEITSKEYPIFQYLIREAHNRGAKIHGLGFTSLSGLKKYHFDSVDSTAWTSGNRFGTTYRFTGKGLVMEKKPEGLRIADHQALSLHNFTEWKKFARYAETHL